MSKDAAVATFFCDVRAPAERGRVDGKIENINQTKNQTPKK
jgi:hypothetical protein